MKEKLLSLYQDLQKIEKKYNKILGVNRLFITKILIEMSIVVLPLAIFLVPFSWFSKIIQVNEILMLPIFVVYIVHFCLSVIISVKLKEKIASVDNQIIENLSQHLENTKYDEILKTFSLIELIHNVRQINIGHMNIEKADYLLHLIEHDEQRKQWIINKMSDKFFFSGIKVVSEDLNYTKTLSLLNKNQVELKSIAKNEMSEFLNQMKKMNQQEREKIISMIPPDQTTFSYPL